MNNYFSILILSLIWVKSNGFPACNTIPILTVDFQRMIALNPFNIYSTTVEMYACGKAVFTGPGSTKDNYTGSIIVLQGNYTFSYDVNNLVNGSLFETTVCSSGIKGNYNIVYSNMIDQSRASVCGVICAPNGIDYSIVICVGRGPEDDADIKRFINQTMSGVPNIINAQDDCPQPEVCEFLTN